jgi:hypothetical protein
MAGDYTRAKITSDLNVSFLGVWPRRKKYGYLFHLDIGLVNVNNKWTRQPLIFLSVCVYLKHKLA